MWANYAWGGYCPGIQGDVVADRVADYGAYIHARMNRGWKAIAPRSTKCSASHGRLLLLGVNFLLSGCMPMPDRDVALSTTSAASVRSRPAVRRRLIVILGGSPSSCSHSRGLLQSSKYEPLVVGMTAPDFSLPDLQGRPSG